jgi:hypothetical protein
MQPIQRLDLTRGAIYAILASRLSIVGVSRKFSGSPFPLTLLKQRFMEKNHGKKNAVENIRHSRA